VPRYRDYTMIRIVITDANYTGFKQIGSHGNIVAVSTGHAITPLIFTFYKYDIANGGFIKRLHRAGTRHMAIAAVIFLPLAKHTIQKGT
jgi:hypothetical protein